MGQVNVSLPSDGSTADVSDYNTPITTIVDEINGNLDNSNISASAAIAGSKLASGAVDTTQLADEAVTAAKVDFGGSGTGIWWEEIGRTTLGTAGDTLSVTFPARRFLSVYINTIATGGTILQLLTFNSDGGTNYARIVSDDFAAKSDQTSNAGTILTGAAVAENQFTTMEIENTASQNKMWEWISNLRSTAGAGTAPKRRQGTGKWANTSDQITTITITNTGTGDFAIGSEIVVLGHD